VEREKGAHLAMATATTGEKERVRERGRAAERGPAATGESEREG
jgi:hypothetical protein